MGEVLAAPLSANGWQIKTGMIGTADYNFAAVYEGEVFGQAERGLLAVMARAHPGSSTEAGARASAQLALYEFVEGYFGARRTFGPKRAARSSVQSINSWLAVQIGTATAHHFVPVSMTALLFTGPVMSIMHIGTCRLYRRRAGVVTPLVWPHLRTDDQEEPARAIGLDMELSVDYAEERAEPGDRYLLLDSTAADHPEVVQAGFALAPTGGNGAALSALVVDILAVPAADEQMRRTELAGLPLRPVPRPGEVWDGFEIGRTLYRGRYTILKMARDTVENRDVVLKIPLQSILQDEVFAAGFMREAWIGSTVKGNVVARYYELPPERRSSLYLAMPYYQGETLEARLGRAPPVSLPDGVGIALKLCEAVQDLAAIDVIHRDLKPENIMLLPKNEVKLIDLGLAYLPGIDMAEVAKPGGTLRYMAPEVLKGVPANARTEVFSLAVTIYRMFAGGAYPFGQHEKWPLSRMRPDLPSWLGEIIARGIKTDPAERFEDAAAMAAALQEGLVAGIAKPLEPKTILGLNPLRFWQILAAIFGIGFFVMLARTLR
jgi:hypothetical protein